MVLTLTKDCEVRRYLRYSWRICDLDGADTDMMACDSSGRCVSLSRMFDPFLLSIVMRSNRPVCLMRIG